MSNDPDERAAWSLMTVFAALSLMLMCIGLAWCERRESPAAIGGTAQGVER